MITLFMGHPVYMARLCHIGPQVSDTQKALQGQNKSKFYMCVEYTER